MGVDSPASARPDRLGEHVHLTKYRVLSNDFHTELDFESKNRRPNPISSVGRSISSQANVKYLFDTENTIPVIAAFAKLRDTVKCHGIACRKDRETSSLYSSF